MRRFVLTLLFALTALSISAPAVAQTAGTPGSSGPAVKEKVEPPFGAGSFDFLVSLGFGNFAYPHIEPSVDIGIIPIGDMSISIGGGVDAGYCLLCEAVGVATDIDIDSWYLWPWAQGNLHLGTLGGIIPQKDFTIDLYIGAMVGPSFYNFTVTDETNTDNFASATAVSAIFGPKAGGRLGLADNTFLAFIEYRALAEIGYSSVTLELDGQETTVGDSYSRSPDIISSDFILGVGVRF